jgi:hypothetical protein
MIEKKLKHLEFIQNIITRMNSNSFLLKGWTITLVSALFALAAKDANINYVLISYIAIPAFWGLDGYFLSIERQFRDLYDSVRIKDENQIDFNLSTANFENGKNTWVCSTFSKTLLAFYLISLGATIIVMLIYKLGK